jgi:putative ATPase
MADLFEAAGFEDIGLGDDVPRPLADRLRPKNLDEITGQAHLLGQESLLRRMVSQGRLSNLILWGPPGTGKTTLAQALAHETDLHFEQLSAIFSGVKDLKSAFERARSRRREGKGTLLFIDEIHRFNKAQQDSFLPVMEDGTIILIGATTENPSFELNNALLSRSQVLTFEALKEDDLNELLVRAEKETGRALPVTKEARQHLIALADGDGRMIMNMAEELFLGVEDGKELEKEELGKILHRRRPTYDKTGDGHYNLISALHKSVRGSDPDAALYWFARMLEGGEDPVFIARRLVRMAVEDIGLADPNALTQANAAKEAYLFLGSPEGELALAQCVIYLASAPKSNAAYVAYKAVRSAARDSGTLWPPKHALNAPTSLMADQGYGDGYEYDHDAENAFSGQNYFPEEFRHRPSYYTPVPRGFEREIAKRLDYWQSLRAARDNKK